MQRGDAASDGGAGATDAGSPGLGVAPGLAALAGAAGYLFSRGSDAFSRGDDED